MTKNLVSRVEAGRMPARQRKQLLLDTYGITETELGKLDEKSPARKRRGIKQYYENIAALIFSKTREKGYAKEFSLAQITLTNIALAMPYKEDLAVNERMVGGEISRCFRDEREQEEERLRNAGINTKLNNLYTLRKKAYQKATGKVLESNLEETIKAWGKQITFSLQDLLFGTKIPPKLTTTIAYLLGVYQVDGSLSNHALSLSGEGENTRTTEEQKGFYETIVRPSISEIFKINGHSNFERGRIVLESEAHSSWLKKIGYGKKDFPNWKKYVQRKNRLSKETDIQLYDRAFFLGMLAAGTRNATTSSRYPFTMHDSQHAKQFAYLANKLGVQTNYDPKNSRTYINREGVETIMKERFELKANGLTFPRIGGFYNPTHIKFLSENYIKMFYVAETRKT